MGNTYVKNGTPVGNEHLCKGCSNAQYVVGYRESDVLIFCTGVHPTFKVPFTVFDCSGYEDKNKPDWDAMQKLAIEVRPTPNLRATPGFRVADARPAKPAVIDEPEDEDADEAVARLR